MAITSSYSYTNRAPLAKRKNSVDKQVPPERCSGYYYAGPDGTRREITLVKKKGRTPSVYTDKGKTQRTSRLTKNWKWFPMEKKVEACTLYAVYGDVYQTSLLSGVPEYNIREWAKEPWWDEILKQVYLEQNDKLGAQITDLLDKSVGHLKDRIENGDYYFKPKTGELLRKPVDARVLTTLFNNLAVQRRLARNEPTSITANKQTLDDKLEKLANEFRKFAGRTSKLIKGEEPLLTLDIEMKPKVEMPDMILDSNQELSQSQRL